MDTDVQTEEINLKDEEEFLISVESTLSTVENSIYKFMQDVPQGLGDFGLDFGLQNVNEEDEQKFQRSIRLFPKLSLTDQENKEEEKDKIAALEFECGKLRDQLENQTKECKTAQEETEHLREQILNQSTYCASLGAVLGNLTWRASKFPQVVDIWLSGDKLGEFFAIVNGSFVAFINTLGSACPPSSNLEYQFIIGLLGIVTNISASPEGREYLITNSNGKNFILKIIKLMPTVPLSQSSLLLKRLMLMTLYNVSMNKTGLQCLFELNIGNVLSYYLENSSVSNEIQLLCLQVLQSITYDLNDPKYIQDLLASLPITKIEEIASSNKDGMSDIAKQVVGNIRNSRKFLSTH